MILEAVILHVKMGQAKAFLESFNKAEPLIRVQTGYLGHELQHCMEDDHQFLLLVRWETLEAHTEGFRGSREYQEWKGLLHHFYEPFPVVHHYQLP